MDLYRPSGVTQSITTSGTSAAMSSAIAASTYAVLITASADAYVTFGSAPTATAANGVMLAADWPTYFRISPGEKVAALQVSGAGTVYVSELTR